MDWGYFGKTFGRYMAVLGLAAGLALFDRTEQPLEERVKPISIGKAELSSEVSDRAKYNSIICGGPITAELLGNTDAKTYPTQKK